METDDGSTTNEDTDPTVDVVSDGATDNEFDNAGCGTSGSQTGIIQVNNFIPNKNDERNSGATYKCVFCNHIFKSHYCYQKHKRRHLNPFTVDFTIAPEKKLTLSSVPPTPTAAPLAPAATEAAPSTSSSTGIGNTTQLPTKDINVQFFPCKICGAKFPSYYFVHKHKKIWHPESVSSPNTPSALNICNESVQT